MLRCAVLCHAVLCASLPCLGLLLIFDALPAQSQTASCLHSKGLLVTLGMQQSHPPGYHPVNNCLQYAACTLASHTFGGHDCVSSYCVSKCTSSIAAASLKTAIRAMATRLFLTACQAVYQDVCSTLHMLQQWLAMTRRRYCY